MLDEKHSDQTTPVPEMIHTEVSEQCDKPEPEHDLAFETPIQHVATLQNYRHVSLSWRSWVAVVAACLASLAQQYAVVSSGFILTFIIRDLGSPGTAPWVIRMYLPRVHSRLLVGLKTTFKLTHEQRVLFSCSASWGPSSDV